MRFIRHRYLSWRLLGSVCGGGLVASAAGCAPAPIAAAELREWAADPAHGLVQEVRNGSHTLTCRYRPTDLLVAQDLENARLSVTARAADSVRAAYADNVYFSLELAGPGGEIENTRINTPTAYSAALAYLNTGIAADTYLATDLPKAQPAAAIMSAYLRQYGATGHSTVLLVFQAPSPSVGTSDYTVIFRDRMFGLGQPTFKFAKADLNHIPPLATTRN